MSWNRSKTCSSVSYTHLDVYKRKVLKIVSDILKEKVEDRILFDFKDENLFNESYKKIYDFLSKFINIPDDNKNNFDNNEQDLICLLYTSLLKD